ncbi:MAG TPA: FkbM family methyltransferase [Caldimonas sp.]|nr:FkbM family methyltransferase [Caldimonas sp.]
MNDTTFKGIDPGVNRRDLLRDGITTSSTCRYGVMKWLTTDHGVGQQLALYGEYSEGELVLLRRLVKPGNTIITAGANIGAHVIPLSLMVGGLGSVIAFEPQPFIIPILEENLRVNRCEYNVRLYKAGLGDHTHRGRIASTDPTLPNNFGGLHVLPEGNEHIQGADIDIVTIDSFGFEWIDLIMLDVEGSEEAALRGARATIDRCRPLLYVEIDKEDRREPLLHYIRDELKYEILFHLPYVYNPDNVLKNPENHFPDQRSIMCLAVPQ